MPTEGMNKKRNRSTYSYINRSTYSNTPFYIYINNNISSRAQSVRWILGSINANALQALEESKRSKKLKLKRKKKLRNRVFAYFGPKCGKHVKNSNWRFYEKQAYFGYSRDGDKEIQDS